MTPRHSFAGTDYSDADGQLKRIDIPGPPPHLGERPETRTETWMWYFAGWEPEYTHDGWPALAARSPERVPLLADARVTHDGQRYYHNGEPDVVAWHVRWMREAGVSTVIFEFIATFDDDGALGTPLWGNRALELAFLGKTELGGALPPVVPYESTMNFAVMWTNHDVPPYNSDRASPELAEYLVTHFLARPNYARVNGRPVLLIWSPNNLVARLGSDAAVAEHVGVLRETARRHGVGEITILAVEGYADAAQLQRLGFDGGTGYHLDLTGGYREEERILDDGSVVVDRQEDFLTQTISGHERVWRERAEDCHTHGLDYIVPVCPMQDWTPMNRKWQSIVYDGTSPENFGQMLARADAVIAEKNLAPVILVEAWNEWGEGGYVEPSLEYGFGWLQALLDGTSVNAR